MIKYGLLVECPNPQYSQPKNAEINMQAIKRGQVFAMAGWAFQQARIGLNVTTELAVRLRAKPPTSR